MKVLFIGGTGIISATVSRQAIAKGLDLYLLNRGLRSVNLLGETFQSECDLLADAQEAMRAK